MLILVVHSPFQEKCLLNFSRGAGSIAPWAPPLVIAPLDLAAKVKLILLILIIILRFHDIQTLAQKTVMAKNRSSQVKTLSHTDLNPKFIEDHL